MNCDRCGIPLDSASCISRCPDCLEGVVRGSAGHASLPTDAATRKAAPLAEGLLWYFPNALAAVAAVSKVGNDQHNPGQPMHHARGKSSDHADCAIRHLIDAGKVDSDGMRHTAKAAWRLLALLQEELEREEGVPLPRNAKAADPTYETRIADAMDRVDEAMRRNQAIMDRAREVAVRASFGHIPNYPRTDTGD